MDETIKNPLPNHRPERLIDQMEETIQAFVKRMENGEETDALLPETSVYQELYIDRGNSLNSRVFKGSNPDFAAAAVFTCHAV